MLQQSQYKIQYLMKSLGGYELIFNQIVSVLNSKHSELSKASMEEATKLGIQLKFTQIVARLKQLRSGELDQAISFALSTNKYGIQTHMIDVNKRSPQENIRNYIISLSTKYLTKISQNLTNSDKIFKKSLENTINTKLLQTKQTNIMKYSDSIFSFASKISNNLYSIEKRQFKKVNEKQSNKSTQLSELNELKAKIIQVHNSISEYGKLPHKEYSIKDLLKYLSEVENKIKAEDLRKVEIMENSIRRQLEANIQVLKEELELKRHENYEQTITMAYLRNQIQLLKEKDKEIKEQTIIQESLTNNIREQMYKENRENSEKEKQKLQVSMNKYEAGKLSLVSKQSLQQYSEKQRSFIEYNIRLETEIARLEEELRAAKERQQTQTGRLQEEVKKGILNLEAVNKEKSALQISAQILNEEIYALRIIQKSLNDKIKEYIQKEKYNQEISMKKYEDGLLSLTSKQSIQQSSENQRNLIQQNTRLETEIARYEEQLRTVKQNQKVENQILKQQIRLNSKVIQNLKTSNLSLKQQISSLFANFKDLQLKNQLSTSIKFSYSQRSSQALDLKPSENEENKDRTISVQLEQAYKLIVQLRQENEVIYSKLSQLTKQIMNLQQKIDTIKQQILNNQDNKSAYLICKLQFQTKHKDLLKKMSELQVQNGKLKSQIADNQQYFRQILSIQAEETIEIRLSGQLTTSYTPMMNQ